MKKSVRLFVILLMLIPLIFVFCNLSYAAVEDTLGGPGTAKDYRWEVNSGDIVPADDSTYDIGESGAEVKSIYVDTLVVGGDSVTGASQISTPMEDQGTYVRIAGDDDIKLYDNGNLTITGDMTADMYVMENGATWDNAVNNAITLLENSDTLTITASGDDFVIDSSDGGVRLVLTDATDGTFDVYCNNVSSDGIVFSQGTNQSIITATGTGNDLYLVAAGGDINLADETITGTGALSIGAITCTSIAGVDTITGSTNSDVISLATDDNLNFQSDDGASTIEVIGFSGYDATLSISADDNEDSGDTYSLTVDNTSDNLTIYNETTALLVISSAGNIDQQAGSTFTMANDETIKNATDDTIQVSSNDLDTVFEVYSAYTTDGDCEIRLHGDAGADAGDRWSILSDNANEDLLIRNDSAVAGTYVTKINLDGSTGDMTLSTGDLTVTGADIQLGSATTGVKITSDGDGAITFLGTSTGSDEDLTINLDDVSNEITVTSSTLATLFNLDGDMDLKVSGNDLTIGETGVKITSDDDGQLTFLGLSAGSDESFSINLDDTSDEISIASVSGVTLIDIEGAIDLQVAGGDFTMPSSTASKPVIWLENTADDATAPSIILENNRATEADGDDCGTIFFRASDDGDATFDAVTILGEATDITATKEAGSITIDVEINDTATEMLHMYGDAGDVTTGHIYLNADEADVDFHLSGNTTADYLVVDATAETTTFTSSVTNMPTLKLENTTDDETCPVIILENDRATETDGDDIGKISFYGSDSADASTEFVQILAEASEINAGDEAGKIGISAKINDTLTQFVQMFGDTTNVDTAHFEINATTADIDTHIDSADQADLVKVDAGSNDVMVTRNLAAANTDAAMVQLLNSAATDDQGTLSVISAVAATSANPTVLIQSSATGILKSSLLVNHDGTAGATTEAAVVIDTDDVNTAALYIMSPVTAAGTTSQIDDYALAVVAEGVGGGASIYRNVSAATEALLNIREVHADSTAPLVNINTAADGSADDSVVTIQASAAAHDTSLLEVINAGVGRSVFVDSNVTTAATLVPTMEIDSQATNGAALIVRAPTTLTGTDGNFDDFVMGISAEGVGGGLHVNRNVDDPAGPLVRICDDLAAITTSNDNTLEVVCDGDGSVSAAVVAFTTTDAAHDQPVLSVTQAGTGSAITIVSGALAVNGDSVTCDGVLVVNATSETSFNDENISNVGDIALDTITSDAATVVTINDGLVGLVEDLTCSAADPGVATGGVTTVISTVVTDDTGASADEVSLTNGTKGQIKIFTLKTDGETTGLKIIPANFASGTYILLEDAGDGCMLVFDGTNWVLIANNGGTVG